MKPNPKFLSAGVSIALITAIVFLAAQFTPAQKVLLVEPTIGAVQVAERPTQIPVPTSSISTSQPTNQPTNQSLFQLQLLNRLISSDLRPFRGKRCQSFLS